MRIVSCCLFLCLFLSCTNESGPTRSDQNTTVDQTVSSVEVLKEFKAAKGDLSKQLDIFRKAVKENFDAGHEAKAVDIFKNVLFNFDTEEHIKGIAPIFLHFAKGQPTIVDFYQGVQSAYVTKYPQSEYSGKVKDVKTIITLIDNKTEMIDNPNFNRFSVPDAKGFIEMTEAFMMISPKDEDAGSQLFKAGNMARRIPGFAQKAVALYDWLLQKQPDHPKAGHVMFLKAYTYDNELNKKDIAEKLYNEFIEKHPDNTYADDAKFLVEHIGKTDQELFESIVNKKGEK